MRRKVDLDNPTEAELACIATISSFGAIPVWRLDKQYGPRWRSLVRRGLVTSLHTVMGEVAVLSEDGIEARRTATYNPPRLLSPGAAADRAYQMEVVLRLMSKGYFWRRELSTYKKRSKGLGHEGTTSILTSLTMQMPDAKYREWNDVPPDRKVKLPLKDEKEMPISYRGMPPCYASISNGGIKLPRIKALYKFYDKNFHFSSWRHGVIIAVPEETPDIRQFVRKLAMDQERQHNDYLKAISESARREAESLPQYPKLVILEVPGPRK